MDKIQLSQAFIDKVHELLVQSGRDDALILVNGKIQEDSLSTNMLVLGVDKQFGDFCGNGSRSCASYLYANYPQFKQFYIRSGERYHLLTQHGPNDYAIKLPKVNFIPNEKFVAANTAFEKKQNFYQLTIGTKLFYYSDIIEPHLLLNEPLSDQEIEQLGKELNQNKALFPCGINLTVFHENQQQNQLEAVTYERGVGRLTKSCGTGSCCAAVFHLRGKIGSIKVKNPGGLLKIYNQSHGVQLKGEGIVTGTY